MEIESQIAPLKTVKIFKTTVQNDQDVAELVAYLLAIYPFCKINFDLEDCENILRVEADQFEIPTDDIIKHMVGLGYCCEEIK